MKHWNEGKVIFLCRWNGTSVFLNRYRCSFRAIEIEADAMLLAKAIDGIYDSDPKMKSGSEEVR